MLFFSIYKLNFFKKKKKFNINYIKYEKWAYIRTFSISKYYYLLFIEYFIYSSNSLSIINLNLRFLFSKVDLLFDTFYFYFFSLNNLKNHLINLYFFNKIYILRLLNNVAKKKLFKSLNIFKNLSFQKFSKIKKNFFTKNLINSFFLATPMHIQKNVAKVFYSKLQFNYFMNKNIPLNEINFNINLFEINIEKKSCALIQPWLTTELFSLGRHCAFSYDSSYILESINIFSYGKYCLVKKNIISFLIKFINFYLIWFDSFFSYKIPHKLFYKKNALVKQFNFINQYQFLFVFFFFIQSFNLHIITYGLQVWKPKNMFFKFVSYNFFIYNYLKKKHLLSFFLYYIELINILINFIYIIYIVNNNIYYIKKKLVLKKNPNLKLLEYNFKFGFFFNTNFFFTKFNFLNLKKFLIAKTHIVFLFDMVPILLNLRYFLRNHYLTNFNLFDKRIAISYIVLQKRTYILNKQIFILESSNAFVQ